MKLLICIALVGAVVSSPVFDEDLDTFNEEFNIMEANVPKEVKEEEEKRLKEAEDEINADNEDYDNGESHYREKLTRFATMPKVDFERLHEGMITVVTERRTGMVMPPESVMNDPENRAKVDSEYKRLAELRTTVPASYSSVAKGHVTSVKNQGNCGSCVAFASTGIFETTVAKAGYGTSLGNLDYSDQYLIDCGYNGDTANGCNGAQPSAYTDWLAKNGGLSLSESAYPYLGSSPKLNCNAASKIAKWNPGYTISNAYSDYSCTETKLKQLVATYGAVISGVYAADNSFGSYASGVYDGCTSGKQANHAVAVVGYGTDGTNGDYWLVKNSWGKNWGNNGYIKIARGKSMCEIGKVCVWTQAKANGGGSVTTTSAPATTKAPGTTNAPATTTTAAPTTTAASDDSAMYCDLTGVFWWPVTRKNIDLHFWVPGRGMFYSTVDCVESVCTPSNPAGITSACQYICGMDAC